ncbi:hypothetical protein GCM10020218_017060 [Dactylosporangium vinaceum]
MVRAPAAAGRTQPRSTSTAVPSGSTSGVSTSKPTAPSTVRPRTRISCAGSKRPVTVTRVHSECSAGAGPTVPAAPLGAPTTDVSGTGVAAVPALIRALISARW